MGWIGRHPANRPPSVPDRGVALNHVPYPSLVRMDIGDKHLQVVTPPDGRVGLQFPSSATQANLFVSDVNDPNKGVPGYEWYGEGIQIPPEPKNDWWVVPIDPAYPRPLNPNWYQFPKLLKPTRVFPAESGKIRVDGRRFVNEQGQSWRMRSVSLFLLFARYLNHQDIRADLAWMLTRGRNCCRVFGGVNWNDGLAATLNYARPWEWPDHDARLHEFFNLLADNGLRCEFSVLTYAFNIDEMRSYLQRVYDVAQAHWNVFVEGGNEVENNGINILEVYRSINTRGVLSAYGNDPERNATDGGPDSFGPQWEERIRRECPALNYGTSHDLQRDFDHSPRNAKDTKEFKDIYKTEWVWDEPVGTIEPNSPGMVNNGNGFWSRSTGGGVRTTNPDVIFGSQIIAGFYAGGYTYHPDCGVQLGRAPLESETTQDGIAKTMCEIEKFLPTDLSLGQYVRPGAGDYGLAWTDGDSDSQVGHAYGIVNGNVQYCVVPMPRPGLVLQAVNGWHIDAVGPVPYLVRLVK